MRKEGLGFGLREEATLQTLTQDVVKTSEIEGEKLDAEQVRSSIARRLGMDAGAVLKTDRNVEGIVEVMLDATRRHDAPLTQERLFAWHAALFPTGRSGMQRITAGAGALDASGPMQVVSGPIGRERVHYEAPAHDRLKKEMGHFLKWFNAPPETDLVIQSALAHFRFVTIHPFEDGNGRIGAVIADMLLARSEKKRPAFLQPVRANSARAEGILRCAGKLPERGELDITSWIEWFLNCLKHAIAASEKMLEAVLTKARFWKAHAGESFNERQPERLLTRLLDGFEGKLASSKWAKLAKCSQDTALRDISDLLNRQILSKDEAGGRSTNYELRLP